MYLLLLFSRSDVAKCSKSATKIVLKIQLFQNNNLKFIELSSIKLYKGLYKELRLV